MFRHPRLCRYFANFGRCKFKDSCAYLHEISENISEFRRDQEKEVEKLRQEVQELEKQVKELRNILNQNSDFPSQTKASTPVSRSTPSCSSTTMVQSNHNMNFQANFGTAIPQLDGILNPLPPAPQSSNISLQCETCRETFKTEEQFNDHDNAHNFCCDECYLCFKTQILADLHVLEYHPNTHYSDTYIPQSTKLLFASGHPGNKPRN